MLKIKSKGGVVSLKMDGAGDEVLQDLIYAINAMYDSFKDEDCGEDFKNRLVKCVTDGSAFSNDRKF